MPFKIQNIATIECDINGYIEKVETLEQEICDMLQGCVKRFCPGKHNQSAMK